jgi:fimbrial chaperone protein
MKYLFRCCLYVCVFYMNIILSVSAGDFSINPLRATFSASQKVSSLTVTNRGLKPTTIQLDIMEWSQDAEGQDVLVPTKDVLANPPIFTLQPKSKQVIRVGLRRPPNNETQEKTYRLILAETPPPLDPNFTGVSFAVRMSVPLFVLPKVAVAPDLQWQLKHDEAGLKLIARNIGTAHSQILNFTLKNSETGLEYIKKTVSNYLLPQQQREWLIDNTSLAVGSKVNLLVKTDGVSIEQDLDVQ